MNDYFDSVDMGRSFRGNRGSIINGVEKFVEQEFDAETSQINLNAWKLRFDIDVADAEEFKNIVREVNELVGTECPIEHPSGQTLMWEYIPTDTNGQKDGWRTLKGGNVENIYLGSGLFPVEAFRVTVREPPLGS
jgi:hypothetical protein